MHRADPSRLAHSRPTQRGAVTTRPCPAYGVALARGLCLTAMLLLPQHANAQLGGALKRVKDRVEKAVERKGTRQAGSADSARAHPTAEPATAPATAATPVTAGGGAGGESRSEQSARRREERDPSCTLMTLEAMRAPVAARRPWANSGQSLDAHVVEITPEILERILLGMAVDAGERCVQVASGGPRAKYDVPDGEAVSGLDRHAYAAGVERVFAFVMLVGAPGECMRPQTLSGGETVAGYLFTRTELAALKAHQGELIRLTNLMKRHWRASSTPVEPTAGCQLAASSDTKRDTTADAGPRVVGKTRTGSIYEVRMVGDAQGYRFEPANVTIKKGDGVKFTMVSGGPHNVAFDEAAIPAGAAAQLDANMSDKMAMLSSNMKTNPGESITVSFANVPTGTYNYHCTPHLAMGMKGVITVQ